MGKFTARQDIHISGFECGTEIKLAMVVEFRVIPGRKQTRIDPAEEPSVEVDKVRFFDGVAEVMLPGFIVNAFTDRQQFDKWLLSEAEAQAQQAAEDQADYARELMGEAQ